MPHFPSSTLINATQWYFDVVPRAMGAYNNEAYFNVASDFVV